MTLLVAMLPFYLLGNFHCLGMCGPLAMMIGSHRYRYYYLSGRILSFSLAGLLAGQLGAVSNVIFSHYHFSAGASLLFGCTIALTGLSQIVGWPRFIQARFSQGRLARLLRQFSERTSLLLLRDLPLATFLFGFFTIALPCGQSLVVFSACALSGSPLVGLLNGLVFATVTSPALIFAMHAHAALPKLRVHYNTALGYSSMAIGLLAALRGLAAMEWIPHLSFSISNAYDIVIF